MGIDVPSDVIELRSLLCSDEASNLDRDFFNSALSLCESYKPEFYLTLSKNPGVYGNYGATENQRLFASEFFKHESRIFCACGGNQSGKTTVIGSCFGIHLRDHAQDGDAYWVMAATAQTLRDIPCKTLWDVLPRSMFGDKQYSPETGFGNNKTLTLHLPEGRGQCELWLWCLGPETLIDGPSGKRRVIDIKGEHEVWTKGGRRWWAKKPRLKGYAPLYRVRLDNGGCFDASGGHRLMTPWGWTELGRVLAFSGVLHPYDVGLYEGGFGDRRDWVDSLAQGYLGDYPSHRRLHDESPRDVLGICRGVFPSQDGAERYMDGSGWLSDGMDRVHRYTQNHHESSHPSNWGGPYLSESHGSADTNTSTLTRSFHKTGLVSVGQHPEPRRHERWSDFLPQSDSEQNPSQIPLWSPDGPHTRIVNVESLGVGPVYDFEVPKYNSYYTEGAYHRQTEEMDLHVIESARLNGIWWTECCREAIFGALQPRLAARAGWMLMDYVPREPWHRTRLRLPARKNKDVYWMLFTMPQNAHNLPDGEVERQRSIMSSQEWNMRGLGMEALMEGLVYPQFSENRHVIQPFKIPDSWPRWRFLDYGFAAPTACGWGTVAPIGWNDRDRETKIVYREHYERGRSIEENANDILLRSGHEKYHSQMLIDPAAYNRTAGSQQTIAQQYEECGLKCRPWPRASTSGEDAMVEVVRKNLEDDTIMIFEDCHNTISEFQTWQYKRNRDGVVDPSERYENKNNHMLDAIRGWCCRRPSHTIRTSSIDHMTDY